VANCPGCVAKLRGSHSAAPPKPTTVTATIWEYRIDQTTGALTPVGTGIPPRS
jgi:hypothetical protein